MLATAAASRTESLTEAGRATAEALNGGYHLAYLIGAGLLGVALLVAALVLRPSEPLAQHPEHAADDLALDGAPLARSEEVAEVLDPA